MYARILVFKTLLVLMLFAVSPGSAQDSAASYAKGLPVHASAPVFRMQMGSTFGYVPGAGSLFGSTLAPSINWEISRRFSLQAGTIFSTTLMNGPNPLFPFTPHMAGGEQIDVMGAQRLMGGTVFAAGAYQVNPRLTLVGAGWMQHSELPGWEMNHQAFDLQSRGMMFGFDYQINDHIRFGAELNLSTGYNPFMVHPGTGFHQHGFYSPSPFHRGARW
jgi:hypothetical protein